MFHIALQQVLHACTSGNSKDELDFIVTTNEIPQKNGNLLQITQFFSWYMNKADYLCARGSTE